MEIKFPALRLIKEHHMKLKNTDNFSKNEDNGEPIYFRRYNKINLLI